MIQPNELRIGNLVHHEPYPDKKWLVDFSLFEKIYDQLVFVTGIPLTPEILEKAGFDWCDSKLAAKSADNIQKLSIQISNLETLDYEDGEFHICGVANHDLVTFWYDIKYLHQLQNLYFALSGEELEINL